MEWRPKILPTAQILRFILAKDPVPPVGVLPLGPCGQLILTSFPFLEHLVIHIRTGPPHPQAGGQGAVLFWHQKV